MMIAAISETIHTEFIPGNCGLSADNPFTTSFAYDFCIS